MRRAVIIQPMFFPWRGQFDLQSRADVVIVLDTVQWVRRHWYNRNLIHGPNSAQWITVPVRSEDHHELMIKDVLIETSDKSWQRRMLTALRHAYGKAPYFTSLFPQVEAMINAPHTHIAPLAEASLRFGFETLGRKVEMIRASDIVADAPDPIARLIALCKAVGATHYLSGPAAQEYIGESTAFADAGITLEWMRYGYPDYPQARPFKERELSILDLLFNAGPEAARYIWPEQAISAQPT